MVVKVTEHWQKTTPNGITEIYEIQQTIFCLHFKWYFSYDWVIHLNTRLNLVWYSDIWKPDHSTHTDRWGQFEYHTSLILCTMLAVYGRPKITALCRVGFKSQLKLTHSEVGSEYRKKMCLEFRWLGYLILVQFSNGRTSQTIYMTKLKKF
jgi:hypothetical protein